MAAPLRLCLLRLSALGDATHVLPLIDALQRARPDTEITWILGVSEAKLVAGLAGVELLVYDKRDGWSGARKLAKTLAGRRFDALLQLQLALRANLLSLSVPAARRIGFDSARAKELHSLVIRERIAASAGPHVLDAFLGFLAPLGLGRPAELHWPLVIPEQAHAFAREHLSERTRHLLISPCASHPLRNWLPERYAAAADFAWREHGLRPVLVGGRSVLERAMADQIIELCAAPVLDLVGKDTLKQLLALLARADVVLSPDSGPIHFAQALNTPTVGLYACTDAQRSGPYRFRQLCTQRYAQAAELFLQRTPERLAWGQKIEKPGVMALISVPEVCALISTAAAMRPEKA